MSEKTQKSRLASINKSIPWILIIGGIIGIVCSLILIYDQIQIWDNPHYIPACSLNPIVSCGTVINSKQGDIFKIPAPIWGLISFPVLVTSGVAILAGAKLRRWFWLLLELATAGGVGFAIWLFTLSLYKVHALCPFCLGVDIVVYTTFWYITLYNIKNGNIKLNSRIKKAGEFLIRHHLDILILWFIILFIWIMHHFWYYYGKHL
ncbi:MAG: vitamin K epoxide reductase family protein [Candidatus Saccharimonadales bacterium]